MTFRHPCVLTLAALLWTASAAQAQRAAFDRLPAEVLDVVPPSARVSGAPGAMRVRDAACRARPVSTAEIRRRIVEVAVQEWAFFGFSVVDQTGPPNPEESARPRRPRRWLSSEESSRMAPSIAGYWAATPQGTWIVDEQNEAWNGPDGVAARWRYPWSAAFVSWVMCEAGLVESAQFQRAVAHHVYIDQAIRARDGAATRPAFWAYDGGETRIEPGDMLCSSRRPTYRAIAERRQQMGQGARTHCDIVVRVDEAGGPILAIGGNVRGRVSLKMLPGRPAFAHLKLRAPSVAAEALNNSPAIRAVSCRTPGQVPQLAGSILPPATPGVSRC
jgi:hypothetical protein